MWIYKVVDRQSRQNENSRVQWSRNAIAIKIKMLSYLAVFVGILCVVNASPQTSSGPLQCRNKFEVYACGSACQTTCATFNQPCPIVNIKCTDACYCIKGYARDQRGVCIPDTDPECERLKPGTYPNLVFGTTRMCHDQSTVSDYNGWCIYFLWIFSTQAAYKAQSASMSAITFRRIRMRLSVSNNMRYIQSAVSGSKYQVQWRLLLYQGICTE